MKLSITRKKKLGGSSAPYWIITGTDRQSFCKYHGLTVDWSKADTYGSPITRMDHEELDTYGPSIKPGDSIEIEVEDGATIFACSDNGILSNEVILDNSINGVEIVTEGGLKSISHPVIKV